MSLHPNFRVFLESPGVVSFVQIEEALLIVRGDALLKFLDEATNKLCEILLRGELCIDRAIIRYVFQVDVQIEVLGKC